MVLIRRAGKRLSTDLTDDQKTALIGELERIIEDDRYPLSPRIMTLKAILNKIRPEPVREPLPRTEALRAAASRAIPPQTVNEIRNVQIEDAVHRGGWSKPRGQFADWYTT